MENSATISIIKGIVKGMEYLHSSTAKKPSLFHQNLSSEEVLIDDHCKPLLSSWGLHKLLADDVGFSKLKESAAMGYLAPEYATTGRCSEKSDVYAFGVIMLEILTGKRRTSWSWPAVESAEVEEIMDGKLKGDYRKREAARLAGITVLCVAEAANRRPTMEAVVEELSRSCF